MDLQLANILRIAREGIREPAHVPLKKVRRQTHSDLHEGELVTREIEGLKSLQLTQVLDDLNAAGDFRNHF